MRRPLFTVGTTMLFTLFILCQVESLCLAVICCGLFGVLFISYLFFANKYRTLLLPTVFLSVAVSCFLFATFEYFVYVPYASLDGVTKEACFTLTEYPTYNDGRYYCMSEYRDVTGKGYKVRLSLPSVSEADYGYEEKILSAQPGDELIFNSYIYTPGGENKSIKQSFKSKGVYLCAYPQGEIELKRNERIRLTDFLKREKKRTVNLLLSRFDSETASVGTSLLMGDKNLLDNGTYEAVKRSGVAHLLAVSGLHLSVWIMLIMKVIENTGLNRRKWAILLLLFDFLVMFFAAFSGSVVRAGVMMAVYLTGIILKEDSDSLNSLGFSAVLLLVLNPYSAMNVSFLLSFTACYSIITVAAFVISAVERKTERYLFTNPFLKPLLLVITAVVITVTVSVYTLPVMTYYFGSISLVAVITNILLIPVSTPVIVSFGLYVMLWFMPVLSDFLCALSFAFTRYLLFCVRLTGEASWAVINANTDSIAFFLTFSVLLFSAPYLCEYAKDKIQIKKLFRENEA